VQAIAVSVRATADIEPAVESFARQPNGGLILPTDTFTRLRGKLIADLAARHRGTHECVSSLRSLLNIGINTARARSSAPQVDDGADAFRVYC
jgi:hypothetical protein